MGNSTLFSFKNLLPVSKHLSKFSLFACIFLLISNKPIDSKFVIKDSISIDLDEAVSAYRILSDSIVESIVPPKKSRRVLNFWDGGAYSLNFSAADPSIYIPAIPYPISLSAPIGSGNGNPLIPLAQFNDGFTDVKVESLAPEDMALGQIVPFEVMIDVNGDTTPENGEITFLVGWNTLTTNGGDFGYDARIDDIGYGVIGAFIDTGDGDYVDAGNNATVSSFSWQLVNDEIVGAFTVTGLDSGDMVVMEAWLVLDDTIPTGIGGNVQSRLIDASTGSDQNYTVANSGSIDLDTGDAISTGNQTVPLLKPSDFFNADVDISVVKSDVEDPVFLDVI